MLVPILPVPHLASLPHLTSGPWSPILSQGSPLSSNTSTYSASLPSLVPTTLTLVASDLEVLVVEIGLMLVCGFVAAMAVLDDGIKQVLEDRVGLLIASHTAHRHDEGVTCGGGAKVSTGSLDL